MTTASPRSPGELPPGELEIFLVAAEESGDRLGAALMKALRQRSAGSVRFSGVGGTEMIAAGLDSLFPVGDFSIIGFAGIPRRLPRIVRHMAQTVRAVLARRPHALVIIDSPAFTLRVARYAHWFDRSIPIIDYVSPSVWAWRSGRARAMSSYIDHVLALLPFEPDVHRSLGGPPCSYVGHPLIDDVSKLRPNEAEARRRSSDPPVVLAMPGSRSSEVARLAGIFGETLARVADRTGPIEVVVPTVPHLLAQVTQATSTWPIRPRIVVEEADKQAALRVARAALAKSGTTTLELAVAGVPMIAAYKVAPLEAWVIRRLVRVPSYILANLVLGQNVVPELVQEECTPDRLAAALAPLLGDTPERRRQVDAFATLDAVMEIGSRAPAARAADIVLGLVRRDGGAMAAPGANG
jgi:lipid-A-disaccharide synthase